MDDADQAPSTPQPTPRSPRSSPPHPWQAIARPGQPHPTWWHTLNTTAWVGCLGTGTAALHLSNLAMFGVTLGAAFLGATVGMACTPITAPEQRQLTAPVATLGGLVGAAAGVWTWLATQVDLFHHLAQPAPWAALAAEGVALGSGYTALRLRVAAYRTPGSAVQQNAALRSAKGAWGRIMQEAGFGAGCTVREQHENWSGHRVLVRLDPDRHDTAVTVRAARDRITRIASRVLAEGDSSVVLAHDALTIELTDSVDMVSIRVRLRQVLTSVIEPPAEVGPVTDPSLPLILGIWEDGEPIEVPEVGPHGVAIGASGSGKSTYLHGMIAQRSRRKHLITWGAGISKFEAFIAPWIEAVNSGSLTRPVLDLIGGGSAGTEADFWSAAYAVAALHVLMTHRMSSPDTPRKNGNLVVSDAHPGALLIIDEVDTLLKFKIADEKGNLVTPRILLPSGRKLSVWEMLVDIASKGRSERCEVELASQRLTEDFWGVTIHSLFTNVARRTAFYTSSSHDASALLKGTRQDACQLRNNAMYMALSGDAKTAAGKAPLYEADTIAEFASRADRADTIGSLSGAEAAALGDFYAQRWTADRISGIAQYFGGRIGNMVSGVAPSTPRPTGGTPPHSPPSAEGPRPSGAANTPSSGKAQREHLVERRREILRRHQDAQNLEELWQMPTVDEPARGANPGSSKTAGGSPSAAGSPLRARIVAVVRGAGAAGVDRAGILAALPDSNPGTVSNALTRLVEAGVLIRTPAGYTLADGH